MQIILPGILPDSTQARALEPHIHQAAPTLQRWRVRGKVHRHVVDTARTACTAYEQWQLMQRGFTPELKQNISTGLGALRAGGVAAGDEPVYLAELVHIALASDGAALVPARHLDIRAEESRALLASAQSLCQDSGFALQSHSLVHWRVIPASPEPLRCASPELVAASSVHDWWPQQPQAWRKLCNSLQMQWFDHPVNQARAEKDLLTLNGLWLFGGARLEQLGAASSEPPQVYDVLYDPWLQQDWGTWLDALAHLERTVFAPQSHAPDALVLIGHDEMLTITPAAAWQFWRRWRRGTNAVPVAAV